MSATLRDAAVSPMKEGGIIPNHVPADEEDIQRIVELSKWLAALPSSDPAEKTGKPAYEDEEEREEREKKELKRVKELFRWLTKRPSPYLTETNREQQPQHRPMKRGGVIIKDITDSLESPDGADAILYEGRISRELHGETCAEVSLNDRIIILNDECLPESMGKNHVEIKGHKYYKVYFRFFASGIYPNRRDNLQFMGSSDNAGLLTMDGLLTDIRFKEKVYLLYALKKRDFYKPILDWDEDLKKCQTEIRNKLYQRIARSCQLL